MPLRNGWEVTYRDSKKRKLLIQKRERCTSNTKSNKRNMKWTHCKDQLRSYGLEFRSGCETNKRFIPACFPFLLCLWLPLIILSVLNDIPVHKKNQQTTLTTTSVDVSLSLSFSPFDRTPQMVVWAVGYKYYFGPWRSNGLLCSRKPKAHRFLEKSKRYEELNRQSSNSFFLHEILSDSVLLTFSCLLLDFFTRDQHHRRHHHLHFLVPSLFASCPVFMVFLL